MRPLAPLPRPLARIRATLARALGLAGLLAGTAAAGAPFARTLASGHVDFQRQVAVARGVGPRGEEGEPALAAARTNLKALLLPHPVDGEVTLGDLAAYHPDLATALEFQLAEARVQRRNALPPDLEEVVLELELGELIQVLLPFLGSGTNTPGPATPVEAPPARVVLRLAPELAADHVPSLLPSVRGLGGIEAIPARGAWLREAYQEPLVTYRGTDLEPREGDWEVRVEATGGLAGATLFIADAAAEHLRRLLSGEEVPRIVVAPGEAADLEVPPAPEDALVALAPPEPRALPARYREPVDVKVDVAGSAPEPAAPREDPRDFGRMLTSLRERLDSVRPLGETPQPASPAEAIAAATGADGRMPPEVLDALPESAYLDDGQLYGAAPGAPAAAPAAPAQPGSWQEFAHPEDPEGLLWESFDSGLSGR